MNDYSNWKDRATFNDEKSYIEALILNCAPFNSIILSGDDEELACLCSIIRNTRFDLFYYVAKSIQEEFVPSPADIPCFSTFDNGAYRLNELLLFESKGLHFSQIGYKMVKSDKDTARIKYGENHAKLARMMSTVTITDSKPFTVKNTALGSYLTKMGAESRESILRITLLQDKFVRYFIQQLQNDAFVKYRTIVSCLSDSTAYRRKTSVKQLMEFLLKGSTVESELDRIDWTV